MRKSYNSNIFLLTQLKIMYRKEKKKRELVSRRQEKEKQQKKNKFFQFFKNLYFYKKISKKIVKNSIYRRFSSLKLIKSVISVTKNGLFSRKYLLNIY